MKLNSYIKKNKLSSLLLKKNVFMNKFTKSKFEKKIIVKIVGGYTVSDLQDWTDIFCKFNKIECNFTEHQWGSGFSSLLNISGKNNDENYLIIINSWRDLFAPNNLDELITTPSEIIKIFEAYKKYNKSKIIISLFDYPDIEISIKQKNLKNVINHLNNEIYKIFENNSSFSILSEQQNVLSNSIEWHSQRDWHSFGKVLTAEASLIVSNTISKVIKSSFQPSKKVLILDLDNTIWGGVIGDDGLKNLRIGDETPEGRIFLEIQSYFKMIKNNGVLLAVVSKNEKSLALEGLKVKKNILKISDFVATRINWKNKSENIMSISKELNLSLDSFVFIDDNPTEREEVTKQLPDVSIPNIGDNPESFIKIINDHDYFNIGSKISKEDAARTSLYQIENIRKKLQTKNKSHSGFLKSLKIEIKFIKKIIDNIERIHQLTNKTNQFNLTSKRLSISEVKKYIKNPKKKIITVQAKDKFGDYGIISVMYLSKNAQGWVIDNWIMSCRVFTKSIENAILFSLIKFIKKNKKSNLKTTYIVSKKNHLMFNILNSLGFLINKKYSTIKSEWILKKYNVKHSCIIKNEI
tara:strand:+ start:3005 stop:4741 length:1737 start_codon:yes stop_codon:yes gene_type:complete